MTKTQAGVENKSYSFAVSWVCTLSMNDCEGTPLDGICIVQTFGSNTVDYAITDLDQTSLRAFTVKEQTPLSDHAWITLYLKRADAGNTCSQPCKLYKIKKR